MRIHKHNLGIIGAGSHFNKNIYPNLKKNNLFEIKGVYSPSKIKLEYYNGIKVYKNIDSLIINKSIKFYYVSNITSLHYETCLKLLKNHKNIICEKPLTLNINNFNSLINLAKKNNLIIFEAFMFKYHKNFLKIESIINKKKIGNIKSINIKFNIPSLDKNNFRYNNKKGGGSYADLGCYTVKMLSLLINSNIDKIYGLKFYDNRNIDLFGNAIIFFKNKLPCTLEWGFDKAYENNMTINTDKELIKVDKIFSKKINEKTKIIIISNLSNKEILIKKDNHFFNMFKYFISLERSKKELKNYYKELVRYQNLYFEINKKLIKCQK